MIMIMATGIIITMIIMTTTAIPEDTFKSIINLQPTFSRSMATISLLRFMLLRLPRFISHLHRFIWRRLPG